MPQARPVSLRAGITRAAWVVVHRYVGLATALFLLLAGLTGSILAFGHELDTWLNPALFRTAAHARVLPVDTLVARIEAADPALQIDYLAYDNVPGHTAMAYVSARPGTGGAEKPHAYNQVFADPATGAILGVRLRGACCLQKQNLIPFLTRFHYSLSIPGQAGRWFMGIVGMLWLADALVALYLTFPRRLTPFWRKWRTAWLVKRGAGSYRLTFDLHRAGGLWLWLLFVVLAISSVDLNLRAQITGPLVSAFSPLTSLPSIEKAEQGAVPLPAMTFGSAWQRANEDARARNWGLRVSGVAYNRSARTFIAFLRPSHDDDGPGLGSPRLFYSVATGALLGVTVPGKGSMGDLFLQAQYPLHSGEILGLPGRVVIAVCGVAVSVLSVTGIFIWLRKRDARTRGRGRV
ncbi:MULTISPECIES: PepSY-associated TM helix domain-containing protein [Cupriavidus]